MDDYDDFNMDVANYYDKLFYGDYSDVTIEVYYNYDDYEEDMEIMYPREEDQY